MDASQFLSALAIIIMIDLVLGGDNAVIIALASRKLPKQQQNKAIFIGVGIAILLRGMFTIFAVWLLTVPLLMLIGAILLTWIGIRLLTQSDEAVTLSHNKTGTTAEYSLSSAIKTIVTADVVMSLDNVLAVAGASHGNIYLIILGLLISVPIIIFGSKLLLVLFKKYPFIICFGAAVIAFTAGKMITHEHLFANFFAQAFYLNWLIPAFTIGLVLTIGYAKNKKAKRMQMDA